MAIETDMIFKRKNECSCCCVVLVSSMLTAVVLLAVLPPIFNSPHFDDADDSPNVSQDKENYDSENTNTSDKTSNNIEYKVDTVGITHVRSTPTLLTELDVPDDPSIVVTPSGSFKADMLQNVRVFHGIPFAKPPVGELRWRPPQTVEPRPIHEVYDATYTRPGCPQKCKLPGPFCPKHTSEDCLYLKLYTPLSLSVRSLVPVYVFIHGGSYYEMSDTATVFNATKFVERSGVIVAMMDYRLGALGFLYTGETLAESHGNMGILDQRMALVWVKENIIFFGGDPQKVTIGGQSAGAQSTFIHLTSKDTKNLYRSVILESPPLAIPHTTREEGIQHAKTLAQFLNCSTQSWSIDVSCLRNVSVASILDAQEQVMDASTTPANKFELWRPVIDYKVVHYQWLESLDHYHKHTKSLVPLMWGLVKEETLMFVKEVMQSKIPSFLYSFMLTRAFKKDSTKIQKVYPVTNSDSREDLSVISTDLMYRCPRRLSLNMLNQHGDRNVWVYMWDRESESDKTDPLATLCNHRVCHGAELVYIFKTFEYINSKKYHVKPIDMKLSDDIIDYYSNFIKYSDPNGLNQQQLLDLQSENLTKSLTYWPKMKDSDSSFMQLHFTNNGSLVAFDNSIDKRCDMWDQRGYTLPDSK